MGDRAPVLTSGGSIDWRTGVRRRGSRGRRNPCASELAFVLEGFRQSSISSSRAFLGGALVGPRMYVVQPLLHAQQQFGNSRLPARILHANPFATQEVGAKAGC